MGHRETSKRDRRVIFAAASWRILVRRLVAQRPRQQKPGKGGCLFRARSVGLVRRWWSRDGKGDLARHGSMRSALTRIHVADPRVSAYVLPTQSHRIIRAAFRHHIGFPAGLIERAADCAHLPTDISVIGHTHQFPGMSDVGTLFSFQIFEISLMITALDRRIFTHGRPSYANVDGSAAAIAFRASPEDFACVLPRRAIRGVLRQCRSQCGKGQPGGDIFLDLPSRNEESVRLDPRAVNSRNASVCKVVVRCNASLVDGLLNAIR